MNVLVTGGGGFLGRRIVELLIKRGDSVRLLARNAYPQVEALGAQGLQVDIRHAEQVTEALRGVDAVIHTAAKAGTWGPRQDYWSVNVDGTRNLLDAAEKQSVTKFVYTSTPSVVGYEADTVGGGQDLPYASRHQAFYPESKAEAERMVLAANSRHIATVALRPHLIFGPGDNHLLPRFLLGHLKGRLRIVGDGNNVVDATYIDNAAWAHLDALDALTDHTAACAGKPYFISNDEPVALWTWWNALCVHMGLPPVQKRIPVAVARPLFALVEWVYGTFRLGEPLVTTFAAEALSRSHWYDMEPAKRDINYTIRVSMAEAKDPTCAYLTEHVVKPYRANHPTPES